MSTTLVNPYCSLEDVQKEAADDTAANADWFRKCINRATDIVDRYTNRDFRFHDHSSSALTVDRRWVQGDMIALPWPVITLTQIDERGSEDSENIIDADDWGFRVGSRNIHCSRDFEKLTYKDSIELTGTFGYGSASDGDDEPASTIPQDVRRAAALISVVISGEGKREVVGLDASKIEVADNRIPPEAKTLLNKLRRFNV